MPITDTIDGIVNEPTVNFVGKDGFCWWVGEVEDHEDPMELGRVRCRVLGYYTNIRGGTTADLPTKNLPWATVLQHTCQAGNDGQGESAGQLQPGAIVMGFFMDGDSAQMPVVIGVMRVDKSNKEKEDKEFVFTGEKLQPGLGVNAVNLHPMQPNAVMAGTKKDGYRAISSHNTVAVPNSAYSDVGGAGSANNIGAVAGINGSSNNPSKPRNPSKPIPASNGVGGPWKTLDYQLNYLFEDLADTAGMLVKAEDGDFLDVATGKLVQAKALTAKIQNFLGSVFAQVVAAIRQQMANLAEQLQLATILGGATGAPYVIWTIIQTAVTTILKALCNVDSQIIGFINDPLASITNIINDLVEGLIEKAAAVVQGVQETIDSVICNVNKIINSVLGVIDRVKTIVDGVGKAKEIIEAWKKGSQIFADGFDLFKNGIQSISGLIALFIKFIGSNCDRKPDGGKDTVGWYPLFGVTHCTDEELAEINKLRGSSRGTCGGDQSGGGLFDSIFEEADPFLTTVKTWVNGGYDMHIGTPGRQATVTKRENGTSHFSAKLNNYEYSKWRAYQAAKLESEKTGTTKTNEELQSEADAAVNANNSGKKDRGNLVADHISWAGVRTQEVHGDDCIVIDNDKCETIYGDYHLDVIGDCHITVGGGFFFNAQGAPKTVDSKGNKKNSKIQKHTLTFGSDVDIMTTGAKFELQGAECNIASLSTKITGSMFENSSTQQTRSAAEQIFSADNSIEMICTNLYNQINIPKNPLAAKSGITTICAGSIDHVMLPGGSATDVIPRYTILNPTGPIIETSGATGHKIATTIFSSAAGGAATYTSGGPMTLASGTITTITATTAIKCFAATIHLN